MHVELNYAKSFDCEIFDMLGMYVLVLTQRELRETWQDQLVGVDQKQRSSGGRHEPRKTYVQAGEVIPGRQVRHCTDDPGTIPQNQAFHGVSPTQQPGAWECGGNAWAVEESKQIQLHQSGPRAGQRSSQPRPLNPGGTRGHSR